MVLICVIIGNQLMRRNKSKAKDRPRNGTIVYGTVGRYLVHMYGHYVSIVRPVLDDLVLDIENIYDFLFQRAHIEPQQDSLIKGNFEKKTSRIKNMNPSAMRNIRGRRK